MSRILLPKKAQSAPPQSKALSQAPILSPHKPTTPCWAGRPNRACAPLACLLTRRLPPKGRASPRRQGPRATMTGGPSFSHERAGLARRLIYAFSRSFPPDNPLLLWA